MAKICVAVALLVLSLFVCIAFGKEESAKSYHLKKSSFCAESDSKAYCSATYDYNDAVERVVNKNRKLNKNKKEIASASGACANALKKAMCSKPKPFCFEGEDDSGTRRICSQLREDCPLWKDYGNNEDHCISYFSGKFTNLTCVAVAEDEKFKGYCPRPTRKMPASYLLAYRMKSEKLKEPMEYLEQINNIVGMELVSTDCLAKIQEIVCLPYYCTDDEQSIIIPNAREKCNAVLKCFSQAFDKYGELKSILKPIKDHLDGGCDKIIEAIKAQSQSSAHHGHSVVHSASYALITALVFLASLTF